MRQVALLLDFDHTERARAGVGDMLDHGWRAAVVHEDARKACLPTETEALARLDALIVHIPGGLGGVKVNRVGHRGWPDYRVARRM